MIAIERGRVDRQGVIQPNATWFALAASSTQQACQDEGTHVAKDAVYHHDEVHKALEALCYFKCAYCESPVPASSSWDVEHYRPKGRVNEDPAHPGYYWLTYDWENLLLSCPDCNKKKKDRPTRDDPTTGAAAGKADHFPLEAGSPRAMTHTQDVAIEKPLLIDPTRQDPEQLIGFDRDGRAVALGGNDAAETSIKIYNLNRKRLRTARQVSVITAVKLVRGVTEKPNGPGLDDALALLADTLGDAPVSWAGVARAICRDPRAFGLS